MKKTALVTGASGGIGKAICIMLAKNGYDLIMQYNNESLGCAILGVDLCQHFSIEATAIKANFENPAEVEALAEQALKFSDKIDVLINNAGISLVELFQEVQQKQARKIMSVNLENTMLLTQKIIPQMINNQSGNIINISSMWGICGASMEVHYSATKAGLIGFSKALAKEVGLSKIRVNCVCPGYIQTKMNSKFSKEDIQQLVDETPLNTTGKVEDVANLVEFLISDKASFITGQIISVDGGYGI